ncbi:MAG: glucosidase, partial [Dehalococcoidia bacterium]|nr:glucosidase [Dehalococcoidia bacterium]
MDPEHARLAAIRETGAAWRRWGPYLSERHWGTVREDYSPTGDAWDYLPHDHARSRAYRWGEDGLLGICDEHALLCFAPALWNERDPILKERLFGLTNGEGNHGEDVKEYYFYLDALPSGAYLKALYKYPQRAFPYDELTRVNQLRSRREPEYELVDTGVFAEDRYFDVLVEYAKVDPTDLLIRFTVTNHGPEAAPIHLLPTLWFRNTWSWGRFPGQPRLRATDRAIHATHDDLGGYWLTWEGDPPLLFTENDTNVARLFGVPNPTPYVKDAFHRVVVNGETDAVNPAGVGTKAAL